MGDQLMGHLKHFLLCDSLTANQMLSLRILCNMLSHPEGEALALRHKDYLLSVVFDLTPPFNKQMQVNFYIPYTRVYLKVDNEINNSNNKHLLRSNTKGYGSKTH